MITGGWGQGYIYTKAIGDPNSQTSGKRGRAQALRAIFLPTNPSQPSLFSEASVSQALYTQDKSEVASCSPKYPHENRDTSWDFCLQGLYPQWGNGYKLKHFNLDCFLKYLSQSYHVEPPGAQGILFYWVSVFPYFKGWNAYSCLQLKAILKLLETPLDTVWMLVVDPLSVE